MSVFLSTWQELNFLPWSKLIGIIAVYQIHDNSFTTILPTTRYLSREFTELYEALKRGKGAGFITHGPKGRIFVMWNLGTFMYNDPSEIYEIIEEHQKQAWIDCVAFSCNDTYIIGYGSLEGRVWTRWNMGELYKSLNKVLQGRQFWYGMSSSSSMKIAN